MAAGQAVAGGSLLGRRRHLALAAYWFGLYFLFTPVGTSLAPTQIGDIVAKGRQEIAQGAMLGAGAFFAMMVPPLVGAWSDRLSTRWGRRRPIVVAGTVGTIASLLVMMTANVYPQLLLGYVLVQLFANAAGAAYSGLIPDVVPQTEFGTASGYLSIMVLVGSAGGLAANVASSLLHVTRAAYAVIFGR